MVSARSSHILPSRWAGRHLAVAVLLHVPDDPRRSVFNLFIFLCICFPPTREEERETHGSLCLCQHDGKTAASLPYSREGDKNALSHLHAADGKEKHERHREEANARHSRAKGYLHRKPPNLQADEKHTLGS